MRKQVRVGKYIAGYLTVGVVLLGSAHTVMAGDSIGEYNTAFGNGHAVGDNNYAGFDSIAEGYNMFVMAYAAEAKQTDATPGASIGIGYNGRVYGTNGILLGTNNFTGIAEGSATGFDSNGIAIGSQAYASGGEYGIWLTGVIYGEFNLSMGKSGVCREEFYTKLLDTY